MACWDADIAMIDSPIYNFVITNFDDELEIY